MSKEIQIKVITYDEDRLNYFTDLMRKANNRHRRLFKKYKTVPYLSEEAERLSDAGREAQFLRDVVEMLEKGYRKQTEWISVDERLPKTSDKVLVYDAGGNINTAVFIRVQGFEDWISAVDYAEKITHWMPIPEAPKGGAE